MAAESTEYARALAENAAYAAQFDRSRLSASPARGLAVLACMDARLSIEEILGLRTGDAHVIRNAGGLATDDAIRSLVISRQLLGTNEVLVIGHLGCGMLGLPEDAVRRDLVAKTGREVELPLLAFDDLEASVREQVERIRAHPWTGGVAVHGLVYDIASGRLRDVA